MSGLSVFHRPQHPLIYNTSNKDDVTFRVVIVSRRTTMVSQIPHALSAQRHTTIKITMFSMRGSRSRLLIGSWRQLPRSRFGIVMPSIANQNLTNRFHVFVHLSRNRSQMVHLFACVLPVYMPISQRSCVRELRVWGGGGVALYWNSLELRTRFAPRLKYHVCLAWLIKCLLCRLYWNVSVSEWWSVSAKSS